ncbi:sigma-70 family RNA polymerase sigma factor [Brevibacillus centrosporus]|uniref:sigma-70 family RNA polymerase sigma factor n=1 Tax=Brevibacillus centrosporus TaxID=54910 RepID=UPI003B022B67
MNAALNNDVDALVRNTLPFVHHILKKYYPPAGYDYEDLYQVGCIGLVKAAKKFDPSFGIKFTTYAGHFIENELRRMIRTQKAVKRTGDVFSMDGTGDEEEGSLADLLANFDSVEEEVEDKLLFTELIRQEPAITMLALQGYTQKEIGQKLGMSRVNVSKRMVSMKKATAAMC